MAAVLPPEDAALFSRFYNVTAEGNFEGRSVLHVPVPPEEFAKRFGLAPEELERRLASMRAKLLEARGRRTPPGRDDKVLADWNGLMIAALANSALIFAAAAWLDLAKRAFDAIVRNMSRDNRLGHAWRAGRLTLPGLASDYAAMIRAALALNEATGERSYLDQALAWQRSLDRHYANPDTGRYFLTADDAEGLVVRPQSTLDEAIPNPNALIAQNLVRLAVLAGDDSWRAKADGLLDALLPLAAENLFSHVSPLNALDLRLRAAEIVVTGQGGEADALVQAALKVPYIDRIVVRAPTPDAVPATHPAAAKVAAAPSGAAFICVGERCSLPVTSPDQIAPAIEQMRHGSVQPTS